VKLRRAQISGFQWYFRSEAPPSSELPTTKRSLSRPAHRHVGSLAVPKPDASVFCITAIGTTRRSSAVTAGRDAIGLARIDVGGHRSMLAPPTTIDTAVPELARSRRSARRGSATPKTAGRRFRSRFTWQQNRVPTARTTASRQAFLTPERGNNHQLERVPRKGRFKLFLFAAARSAEARKHGMFQRISVRLVFSSGSM
jgi:hypothetical protein